MKQKLSIGLVVVLLLLGICSVAAQSGYKDYTWGMTVAQVKIKCPDIERCDYVSWSTPSRVFLYLYSDEIKMMVPNPLEYGSGQITEYQSQKDFFRFYFINKSLVGVELWFLGEDIFSELQKQYGEVDPVSGAYGNYRYRTASWQDNKNRIIVWEGADYGVETVTYINGNWLNPLIDKAISAYRKEKADTKSKLD